MIQGETTLKKHLIETPNDLACEGGKTRVLMVLDGYPTISQTYMLNEVEAVRNDYEVLVISYRTANLPHSNPYPYSKVRHPSEIIEFIQEFRPHVLHGHYFWNAPLLAELGEKFRIPFTIRRRSDSTTPMCWLEVINTR